MYFMGRFLCSNVWIGVEFGVEIFRNRHAETELRRDG